MNCLDLLAGTLFVNQETGKYDLAQKIIDILSDYPRPKEKGSCIKPEDQCLAAYLYTSTARNTANLSQLKCMPYDNAFGIVQSCIESALTLLVE